MALRYLVGKLRVPAGTALRRAEGSRGVATRPHHQKFESREEVTSELWTKEDMQRMRDKHEAMIRDITEASLSSERDERLEALYATGGTLLGLFLGVLMLRYESHSGGKIRKMVCGVPRE